jgi:hypothetical protein
MGDAPCPDVPTAELALDLLDGRERADVLAHVGGCARCREDLAAHRALADRLATLAPAADPPAGFEAAVLARTRPRRRRPPRVLAWGAAAALAVAVAVGAGLVAAGGGHGRSPAPAVTAALVTTGGRSVGDVTVTAGAPRRITMAVHGLGVSGPVRCDLQAAGGAEVYAGAFPVTGGDGTWSAALPATGTLAAARLVGPGGQVLATAHLP